MFAQTRKHRLPVAKLAFASLFVVATQWSVAKAAEPLVAIDVMLLPDETMVDRAKAANARLRENYPQGYSLGQEQVPHITLAQCYVREKDLPVIEATLSKLAETAQPLQWELTATGYAYANWGGVAITGIGVKRTRRLDDFQASVVKAIGVNAVRRGTAAAFSTSRDLPRVEKEIVDYVEHFVPNSSGQNYQPHVTVGVAHEDFVKWLAAEPFERFTFKPAGLAIYQLGGFGTAQKKLWEWKAPALQPAAASTRQRTLQHFH